MNAVEQTVRQSKTLLEHLEQTMPGHDARSLGKA